MRHTSGSADGWGPIPQAFRSSTTPLPAPWEALFGPLRAGGAGMVIGQIGQSIDGRIAPPAGHPEKYINGPAGLEHLHRLRALVDAVAVGVGTVIADDPQLTVRRVSGPQPARVVIDPRGRAPAGAKVFTDDGVRRILVTAQGAQAAVPAGVEVIALPATDGRLAPAAIRRSLAERGLQRVLLEGGAETLSRFIAAQCLDRLHIVVAPIILGAGPCAFNLETLTASGALVRTRMRAHALGDETLFDCDLER
ncbi:MAG TPA: RibD family protein [Pseudolabrys sp.]|nr:RibD family protein [Pseudolabrys sp.]